MTAMTMCLALVAFQGPAGVMDGGEVMAGGSCAACDAGGSVVMEQVVRLQTSPVARERERAARLLRQVDWRSHREVPGALAYSLTHDRDRAVRREVAETLVRMDACDPAVHSALRQAATGDPSLLNRLRARRGLRSVRRRGELSCGVCGAAEGVVTRVPVVPGKSVELDPIEEPAPEALPRSEPSLDSTPLPRGGDDGDEPAPRGEPGPPVDSSVSPRPAPGSTVPQSGELEPLPDPVPAPAAVRPEAGVTRARPRVAAGPVTRPRGWGPPR